MEIRRESIIGDELGIVGDVADAHARVGRRAGVIQRPGSDADIGVRGRVVVVEDAAGDVAPVRPAAGAAGLVAPNHAVPNRALMGAPAIAAGRGVEEDQAVFQRADIGAAGAAGGGVVPDERTPDRAALGAAADLAGPVVVDVAVVRVGLRKAGAEVRLVVRPDGAIPEVAIERAAAGKGGRVAGERAVRERAGAAGAAAVQRAVVGDHAVGDNRAGLDEHAAAQRFADVSDRHAAAAAAPLGQAEADQLRAVADIGAAHGIESGGRHAPDHRLRRPVHAPDDHRVGDGHPVRTDPFGAAQRVHPVGDKHGAALGAEVHRVLNVRGRPPPGVEGRRVAARARHVVRESGEDAHAPGDGDESKPVPGLDGHDIVSRRRVGVLGDGFVGRPRAVAPRPGEPRGPVDVLDAELDGRADDGVRAVDPDRDEQRGDHAGGNHLVAAQIDETAEPRLAIHIGRRRHPGGVRARIDARRIGDEMGIAQPGETGAVGEVADRARVGGCARIGDEAVRVIRRTELVGVVVDDAVRDRRAVDAAALLRGVAGDRAALDVPNPVQAATPLPRRVPREMRISRPRAGIQAAAIAHGTVVREHAPVHPVDRGALAAAAIERRIVGNDRADDSTLIKAAAHVRGRARRDDAVGEGGAIVFAPGPAAVDLMDRIALGQRVAVGQREPIEHRVARDPSAANRANADRPLADDEGDRRAVDALHDNPVRDRDPVGHGAMDRDAAGTVDAVGHEHDIAVRAGVDGELDVRGSRGPVGEGRGRRRIGHVHITRRGRSGRSPNQNRYTQGPNPSNHVHAFLHEKT